MQELYYHKAFEAPLIHEVRINNAAMEMMG
jgi:hypothetical protein